MREVIVIADASPIIALVAIGQLDLLQHLYERIMITDIVRSEIHADLPEWIEVTVNYDRNRFNILQLELDPGESSAISLALEYPGSKLIMDEFKGRRVAQKLG
jgi:predicted nucleic acid-binding protein